MASPVYGDINFLGAIQTLAGLGATPLSGWIEVSDTWTSVGGNVFTVPTGAGLIYQLGYCERWKQGGAYLYGTISGVGTTSVTLINNNDYAISPSPAITNVAYSSSINPYGWPGWFHRSETNVFGGTGGGLSGAFAVTNNTLKYFPVGRMMIEVADLQITNIGSFSGTVTMAPCITTAIADSGNVGFGGGITANASLAPKGYVLVSTTTSFRFAKTPATRLQWTDMAANDWVGFRIMYQW